MIARVPSLISEMRNISWASFKVKYVPSGRLLIDGII
jgi:hypothetical protein